MLRIVTSKSVGQAKKYYSEGLTREGYYAEGQEMAGEWGGKAAKFLGLSGSVQKREFVMLCDNLHPETGEPLTPRFNDKRRVGYDFNFNPPKPVTVAAMIFKDERIFPAFQESVRLTMQEVEKSAATRVRTNGRDEDRPTENLAWAEFFHFTARPVDGIPDPHMHAHVFTFNVTWDGVEQRYKAAQLGEIVRKASYYQAVFHAHLAEKLQELGYEIVPVNGSFEIVGIPHSVNEKFSRRADKIMAEAKRRGLTTAADRDGLAALTREKKAKGMSIPELEPHWEAKCKRRLKSAAGGARKVPHLPSKGNWIFRSPSSC
jgi:conjugative relaxase-like TrwC/TraI family protein